MALVNNYPLQKLSALPYFTAPHLHCISQAQERDLKSLESFMDRESCQQIPLSHFCIPKQPRKDGKIAGNIKGAGEALPQNTGYSYKTS